jgi:hypothetical protein
LSAVASTFAAMGRIWLIVLGGALEAVGFSCAVSGAARLDHELQEDAHRGPGRRTVWPALEHNVKVLDERLRDQTAEIDQGVPKLAKDLESVRRAIDRREHEREERRRSWQRDDWGPGTWWTRH